MTKSLPLITETKLYKIPVSELRECKDKVENHPDSVFIMEPATMQICLDGPQDLYYTILDQIKTALCDNPDYSLFYSVFLCDSSTHKVLTGAKELEVFLQGSNGYKYMYNHCDIIKMGAIMLSKNFNTEEAQDLYNQTVDYVEDFIGPCVNTQVAGESHILSASS
jgi:hypothetical protein